MKKIIKELIGFLLVKWFFISGKKTDGMLSITFHKPSVKMFNEVADQLEQLNYKIIPLTELETALQQPPKNEKLAFITLDDGWNNNLDLLPVLEKRKIPICIFVSTEPVKDGNFWWEYAKATGQQEASGIADVGAFKALPDAERLTLINRIRERIKLNRSAVTLNELKVLAESKWVTIGSHSVTHPILKNCTAVQQDFELVESKRQLQEWVGKPVHYFAYPNGDYNEDTLKSVKKAGYQLCFTDRHGTIQLPWNNHFEIPRNSLNDDGGYYENYSKLIGIWQKVCGEN